MPQSLTTAVIDALRGAPAKGMLVDLFQLPRGAGERRHLRTIETDASGAMASPLLAGDALMAATYELLFHVGRYFRSQPGIQLEDAPFLDVIPVRFSVSDRGGSWHLVLVASPWSYMVYRG